MVTGVKREKNWPHPFAALRVKRHRERRGEGAAGREKREAC